MDRTNEQRAELAFRTVLVHKQYLSEEEEDIEEGIIDLATNLLHLAPQYGLDADELQRISRHHYNAEVAAEDNEPCIARDIPACNAEELFTPPWPEEITSMEVGPPHRDPAATQFVTIKGTRRGIRNLLNEQWGGGIEDFTQCIERQES